MASDSNDRFSKKGNPFTGLLQGVVTIAPISIGAYIGLHGAHMADATVFKRNASSKIIQSGKDVGKSLREKADLSRARTNASIGEQLLKGESLKNKLRRSIEERNVVLQSLLSAFDDPAFGQNQALVGDHKDTLIRLMSKDLDNLDTDAEDIIKGFIATLDESGTPESRARMAGYLGEFNSVRDQIKAPNVELKSGGAFNKIPHAGLSPRARQNYERLSTEVGHKSLILELVESNEISTTGQYARVYERRKGDMKGKYLDLIALDIDTKRGRNEPFAQMGQVSRVRSGEHGTTRYVAPNVHGDAMNAWNFMRKKKNASFDESRAEPGVLQTFEEYDVNRFSKNYQEARRMPSLYSAKKAGEGRRMDLAAGARITNLDPTKINSAKGSALIHHLNSAQAAEGNVILFRGAEDLTEAMRDEFHGMFVGNASYDLGVGTSRLEQRSTEGKYALHVGLREGSPVSWLRTGGEINRASSLPITARAEQVAGRTSMFLPGKSRSLGMSFKAGAGAENIEWSKALTGASNRAILLDVSEHDRLGVQGLGEVFSQRGGTILKPVTKPVYDPGVMKQGSSVLLNRLMQAYDKGEGMVKFSPDDIKAAKGYLGIGSAGIQQLGLDPFAKEYGLMIESISPEGMIRIAGYMEKDVDEGAKFFSTLTRATQKKVTEAQFTHITQGVLKLSDTFLSRHKIRSEDTLVGAGDMLGKAPDYLHIQMISGLGLVKQMANPFDTIEKAARGGAGMTRLGLGGKPSKTASITAAVIEELAQGGVDDEAAGRVLAGVWATSKKDKLLGHAELKAAIETAFGSRAARVKEFMDQGVALGGTSVAAGTAPGDWAKSLGATEQRFFKMFQHRLQTSIGMSPGDVSDILSDVYSRKISMSRELKMVAELSKVQASLLGSGSLLEEIAKGAEVQRFNLDTLSELLNAKGEAGLVDYLKTAPNTILDLRSDKSSFAASAIETAARDLFGGQTEILLGGQDLVEQMHGVTIRTPSGVTAVLPEYSQLVQQLSKNLYGMSANDDKAVAGAHDALRGFKEGMTELFGRSTFNLTSGKLRGSAFLQAQSYDLVRKLDINDKQAERAIRAVQETGGTAIFMDTRGFLGAISDFMGTPDGTASDVGNKLERYFTGLEGGESRPRGIANLFSRHPMVSMGHAQATQVFRHIKEVGLEGSQDLAWKLFTDTEAGQKALYKLKASTDGTDISSFRDVARLGKPHNEARKQFFRTMASNLSSFVGWEGGGSVYLPRMQVDLHYDTGRPKDQIAGGNRHSFDFSTAASAVGDHDGDYFQAVFLNRKSSKDLLGTLTSQTKNGDWISGQARYLAASHVFTSEATESIAERASGGALEDVESMRQDLRKEKGIKQVGPLDVALNRARTAAIGYSTDETREVATQALGLMRAMEELPLKGKKHERYIPFANMLTEGFNDLFATGNIDTLRDVLETQVYRGSKLAGEGITINDVTALGAFDQETLAGQKGLPVPEFLSTPIKGQKVQIEPVLEYLQSVVQRANAAGTTFETANDLINGLMSGNRSTASQTFHNLMYSDTGGSLQSAMARDDLKGVASVVEGIASRMKSFNKKTGNLNRHSAGPIAVGMAGSILLGAIVGGQGYAPDPILEPGEVVSPRVTTAIANRNLFSQAQVGPTPESFERPMDPYSMMDRPLNTPTTYMNRPNSYQVRGSMSSASQIPELSGYINQLTRGFNSGSLTINDQRRPITRNYLDKLLGT